MGLRNSSTAYLWVHKQAPCGYWSPILRS